MNNLKDIIIALDKIVNETKFEVDDKTIFENAIKIFISDKISESKKGFFSENVPVKSELKNEQPNVPTIKQIDFLNKNKIKIPNTKEEATKLIKERIDKIKREKEKIDY